MRKRARRIVIGLGLAVVALVLSLLALEPNALVAVWRARTSGHAVMWPRPGSCSGHIDIRKGEIAVVDLLQFVADSSRLPIVIDERNRECLPKTFTIRADMVRVDVEIVRAMLKANGLELSRESEREWSLKDYRLIDLNW